MFHAVTIRILAIAACGVLLAGEAGALTLGRARGATLIGRPLEITVPVTLDAATGEIPCPSAELFYGDTRVAAPSVRWEASSPSQGVVRITSPNPLDEPMATVYLRVGCSQPSTRRYVLLAEPPPEDEPAARTAPAREAAEPRPVLPVVPAPAPRASAQAPANPPRRDVAVAAPAVPAPAAQRPVRPPRPAAPATKARKPAAPAPQARLKLEPLDLGVERDPTLRLSAELAAQAAVDPQRREALGALWRALQRAPEQTVEEAIKLQGLERDLASLRDVTRQNATALAQLQGQVEQARGDRRRSTLLVTGLAVALAALLAWLAWRWYSARQMREVGRWFEAHGESVQGNLGASTQPAPAAVAPPAKASARASAPAARSLPSAADAASVKVTAPAPLARATAAAAAGSAAPARSKPATPAAPVAGSPSTWSVGSDFHASRGGTVRMVGVEELIDVHDKADFFLSIGETEQALAVLEAHVHDQVETGALAWLDLLELYHSLGRRAEFERLRAEFRQRFTAQVPDFDHFDEPSGSLEDYGRALSRIVALWPSRKVLEVIEESIFRKSGPAGGEPFSLQAYRELVLLYHVARDMAPQEPASVGKATNFSDTSLQPLHATDRPVEPPLSEVERLMVPPPSARLGVDIDLDDSEARPSELGALDFDISTFDPAGAGDDKRD